MNNGLTSGLPSVDYVVSADVAEPSDGWRHYAEQLVRLPPVCGSGGGMQRERW